MAQTVYTSAEHYRLQPTPPKPLQPLKTQGTSMPPTWRWPPAPRPPPPPARPPPARIARTVRHRTLGMGDAGSHVKISSSRLKGLQIRLCLTCRQQGARQQGHGSGGGWVGGWGRRGMGLRPRRGTGVAGARRGLEAGGRGHGQRARIKRNESLPSVKEHKENAWVCVCTCRSPSPSPGCLQHARRCATPGRRRACPLP